MMTPDEIHDAAVAHAEAVVRASLDDPKAALAALVGPDVACVLAEAEGTYRAALMAEAYRIERKRLERGDES